MFQNAGAQTTPQESYNRFQYHKFKWRTFHTEAFHVYFPLGYDSLGKYLIEKLPEVTERVKHRMITRLLEPPNAIVYPSPNQLYESNIGMFEIEDKTLPTFVSKGNRLVLFFNGSHADLEAQLQEAMVRAIWEAQLNNDLEQQAKGNNKETIPFWFNEGAIRYFAHQWPVQAEDELKRSFLQNDFQNWQQVIAYQPRLSGQAFCYFLTDRFYEQAVAQLYGQLKKKKDLRRSIRLIAKKELDSLYILCFDYYKQRFAIDTNGRPVSDTTLSIKRKKGIIRNILPGDNQQNISYINSHNNKRTVYNYSTITGANAKLQTYKLPPWINDLSKDQYPLLSKDESGNIIITQPVKGKIVTAHYSSLGGRFAKNEIVGIDGITTIRAEKNNEYLLTGYLNGQSDVVSYDAGTETYTPHTNDKYDDANVARHSGKIYFNSTRPFEKPGDTSIQPMAQGIYTVQGKHVQPIMIDTIPYIRWDKPVAFSNNELIVTHTENGTERFAIINTTSRAVTTLGNYKPTTFDITRQQAITYSADKDSIHLFGASLQDWVKQDKTGDTTSPWLIDYRKREAQRALEDSLVAKSKNDNYSFLKGILIPKDAEEQAEQRKDSIAGSMAYNPKRIKPYILQLHSAYFSAKANNDYFINRYQPYLNYQGQFKFPEIGAMLQAGFTDLFEDHHVGIGFRIPAGTEGSDFFINYNNTKKNLNWGLTYFRKVETVQPDVQRAWVNENGLTYPNLAKVKTHYYGLSLQRPITYYLSVGFEQAFRNDRTIFLSTDKYSLPFEDIKSLWSISTLSVKQYKLRPTLPMLHKGYSAKLLLDGFKAFTQKEEVFYAVAVKGEYHQPLYKYITLVTRAQVGHSGGESYMLYNIAGMDNNVTVKVDSNVHFAQTAPYAFQSLITPFRGHRQNTLYGNQYAVFNADLYFPLFQTLILVETPLSFINLLQLGVFSDVATAKESWQKPQVNANWLWSYGLSARSKLAGYSLRMDVAWPGTFNKKPLWYFSLGSNG